MSEIIEAIKKRINGVTSSIPTTEDMEEFRKKAIIDIKYLLKEDDRLVKENQELLKLLSEKCQSSNIFEVFYRKCIECRKIIEHRPKNKRDVILNCECGNKFNSNEEPRFAPL